MHFIRGGPSTDATGCLTPWISASKALLEKGMISQNHPHNSVSSQYNQYEDNKDMDLLWNISHHRNLLTQC